MKKYAVGIAGIIVMFLSFSCLNYPKNMQQWAKTTVVWDESLPQEESAMLFIQQGLTVTAYNGIPVQWKDMTLVVLPPGKITLTLDADYDMGYTHFKGSNWPFEWNLKAGDHRYLRGWNDENNRPAILVVDPYDKTPWEKQPSYRVPVKEGPTVLQ